MDILLGGHLMKKLLSNLLILLALVILPHNSVFAEKVQWKDPDFNFKEVQTIQLKSITLAESDHDTFTHDKGAVEKIEIALKSALSKRKIKLLSIPTEEALGSTVLPPKAAPLTLEVTAYRLGTLYTWHDAWTERKAITRKVQVLDDGKYSTISIPDTITVEHPRRKVWKASADLEIIVRNASTGQAVYSLRDSRENLDSMNNAWMLKDIAQDFAKDVSRN